MDRPKGGYMRSTPLAWRPGAVGADIGTIKGPWLKLLASSIRAARQR